jgi:hypothetical protein
VIAAVIVLVVVAAMAAGSAQARTATEPVQVLTVVNAAGVSAPVLARVERAVTVQAQDLRRWYGTPLIRFAAGGWPVLVTRDRDVCGDDATGCHGYDGTQPTLVVTPGQFSISFSHEILEALADPTLDGHEVCDPVEGWLYSYKQSGVRVSDFVLPRYFEPHKASQRLDFTGRFHHGYGR